MGTKIQTIWRGLATLLDLDALGALQVSLSDLARYLGDHSNLSSSYATLYRLLKKYRQERG